MVLITMISLSLPNPLLVTNYTIMYFLSYCYFTLFVAHLCVFALLGQSKGLCPFPSLVNLIFTFCVFL